MKSFLEKNIYYLSLKIVLLLEKVIDTENIETFGMLRLGSFQAPWSFWVSVGLIGV